MNIRIPAVLKMRNLALLLVGLVSLATASAVQATIVIPASERSVLLELYNDANGDGWVNNTGWNGAAGTECSWYGVSCSQTPGAFCQISIYGGSICPGNVSEISLPKNKLWGAIQSVDLNSLPYLTRFDVSQNALYLSIPDFSKTAMRVCDVYNNQLSGSIPNLSGLAGLQSFNANFNQLTGSIPSLAGLTYLYTFDVGNNQLTGSIPSLTGLTRLQEFAVYANQLTGQIPDLSALTHLQGFTAGSNQLTGSIPPLDGLVDLNLFDVHNNQLTGSIPPLATLADLEIFDVHNNHLTGSVPCLSTASPCSSTLTQLTTFAASGNLLTGAVPSLAGLGSMQSFNVAFNDLSGTVPAAPAALTAGTSGLCPNGLGASPDGATNVAWDAATGNTPWNSDCGGVMTQTITFTSQAPLYAVANPAMGAQGTYIPSAVASSGPGMVGLSVDASSQRVCRINNSGVVTYFAPGLCTIDANAYGSGVYAPAAQVQQSFQVILLLRVSR